MDIERNIFPIIEQSINEYSVTLITGASGRQDDFGAILILVI